MFTKHVRKLIKLRLRGGRLSIRGLAKLTGVNFICLSRFIRGQGISSSNLDKIVSFLWNCADICGKEDE